MSLMDWSTTPEEILEDEEIMQAVGALAQTAAVSVWSGILEDAEEFGERCKLLLETVFPALIAYQRDKTLIQEDLEKLLIFLMLFIVAFGVLAPSSSSSSSRQQRTVHARNQLSASVSSSALHRAWYVGRHAHASSAGAGTGTGVGTGTSGECASPPRTASQQSQGEESDSASRFAPEEDTDEERFETVWPGISQSNYARLVLPPSCKLVEKPSLAGAAASRRDSTNSALLTLVASAEAASPTNPNTATATAATTTTTTTANNEDDNPAQRLRLYGQHFLHFLRSLLYYDYAEAAWTLILWTQGIRRQRKTASGNVTDDDDDDNDDEDNDDDDEDEEEDAASRASIKSGISLPLLDPASPRRGPASNPETPFTTPTAAALASPVTEPKIDSDNEDHAAAKPATVSVATKRSAMSALSPLEEEKKESPLLPNDLSPVIPPTLRLDRHTSDKSDASVYHELMTNSEYELYESTAPHPPVLRKPKLQQRALSSGKETNALQAYRAPHEHVDAIEESPTLAIPQLAVDETASPTAPLKSRHDATLRSPVEKDQSARYYFETANSQDSLKRMSVEIPVPDKNGYILGDEHLVNSSWYTPVLVFVNSRSGPQQGHLLITQLRRLLNPIQVWDLANGGPETVLESFCALTRLRIVVCGGDGTVSWIISALEKMNLQRKWPPIAILPLGTGNDLARIHGWGGGYNNESLIGILQQISESYISLLDRWEMTVEDSKGKVKEVKSFTNYIGVGVDAEAALQVHYLRESRPDWFFSRLVNKAWYGIFGAEDYFFKASSVNLRKEITLIADGVEIPLPADSQGIIVLNIDSYAGGVPLWSHGTQATTPPNNPAQSTSTLKRRGRARRTKSMSELEPNRPHSLDRMDSVDDMNVLLSQGEKFAKATACEFPSSCQDGVLDVVSIRGAFHLGQIQVGLGTAQKICQCREATIRIKKKVAIQIDGEPRRQNTCTLHVKRKNDPAVMLHRSADDGGVELEMSKLLDWAEERQLIDGQVHSMLMKEFSRRIESKTRQRRMQSQDNIMHTLKRAIGSTGAMSTMPGAPQWQGQGGIAF